MAGEGLTDTRTGTNRRHTLLGQFRQSVFGRLAGLRGRERRRSAGPRFGHALGGRSPSRDRTGGLHEPDGFWSYQHLSWISPRSMLFITGDRAHSRIFSEHAYRLASERKELFIVPNAGHADLYDRVELIPWNKLQSFFTRHLTV